MRRTGDLADRLCDDHLGESNAAVRTRVRPSLEKSLSLLEVGGAVAMLAAGQVKLSEGGHQPWRHGLLHSPEARFLSCHRWYMDWTEGRGR